MADDGFVVLGTGEALGDGKGAARVTYSRLVRDGREAFLAGVAVVKGVLAATPKDVGDTRRPNRPCKTEPVVLVHRFLFVCSNWYTVHGCARRRVLARSARRTCGTSPVSSTPLSRITV